MSDVAVEVRHVWKRFHRGEIHDSLRDVVPALVKRLLGRGRRRDELGEGDFWALRDVSFQVRRGEVLGIIGANGAGKSTLLKVLARILRPNRGRVRVDGRLRALIEIAAGFHGDLTGRENIYLNGSILGMRKREIEGKFDEIVEFAGIEEFLDTPVKRYSSGMYARLGFAVAAHLDPEILLVDEVLAVGDAAFQRKCLGKMRDVAGGGRTVLFVSHNMPAIQSLCHRALVLERGTICFEGRAAEAVGEHLARAGAEGTSARLSDRTDRRGTGAVRIVAVDIQGSGGPGSSILMGGQLAVKMSFECRKAQPDCNFGFHICDAMDQVIYRVITRDTVGSLPTISSDGHITCAIAELRLLPGKYRLTVIASSNASREILDHLRGAAEFEVLPNDVFGTGKVPEQGTSYTPCQWTLATDEGTRRA